jgi:hypothetical protein
MELFCPSCAAADFTDQQKPKQEGSRKPNHRR